MNNMKKIFALVLAMLLVLGMTSALAAVDMADYKQDITFTGVAADDGNVVKLYKLLSAQIGDDNAMTYTATSNCPDAYDTVGEITTAMAATNGILTMANAIGGIVGGTTADYDGTFENGSAVVEDVMPGWYYAIVSGQNNTGVVYQNMLINTTPKADGNSWTIALNNETPAALTIKRRDETIEKVIGTQQQGGLETSDGYTVGDDVPFTITTTIPNYPANSKVATFQITDEPSGLTLYQPDDSTHAGDEYTVTVQDDATSYHATTANVLTITVSTNNKLTIAFEKDYILAHAGKTVTVNYSSKLVGDPDPDGATANNTARIIYNPNPHESGTVNPPDTTDLKTYGLVFEKVDENSNPLAGATFTLYDANGAVVKDKDGNDLTMTTTVVNYGTDAAPDNHAYIWFTGLEAGSYTIKETGVPHGYTKHADIPVSVNSTVSTGDNPTTSDRETNFTVLDEAVTNTRGINLPATGGIGTTIFYVGGGILVLAAVILLVTKRRMSSND